MVKLYEQKNKVIESAVNHKLDRMEYTHVQHHFDPSFSHVTEEALKNVTFIMKHTGKRM